jgi:hypothetical protein
VRQIAKNAPSGPLYKNRINGLAKLWSMVGNSRSARLNNSEIHVATRNLRPPSQFPVRPGAAGRTSDAKEEQMNMKRLILTGCSIVVLSVSTAMAGPCDTAGRAANLKDAGSGPASVGSGQTTTGMAADAKEHPPTSTMNRAADNVAASSQDTQKQMQGQPTAAQQAQGAKPDERAADKGC